MNKIYSFATTVIISINIVIGSQQYGLHRVLIGFYPSYTSSNFQTLFGPISVTYMADPLGQNAIECGFSNLPQ